MTEAPALDVQEIRSKLIASELLIQQLREGLAFSQNLFDKRDSILREMRLLKQSSRPTPETMTTGSRRTVKRKKGGRPKLMTGQGYGQPVQVRVTEEDYKTFQHVANSNGQTLSEWIRTSLRAAATSHEILMRLVQ